MFVMHPFCIADFIDVQLSFTVETEPLIPANTRFLLTTNSKYANGSSGDGSELGIKINVVANDRYFDRPEVLKAFREQAIIQTPEFESIGESSSTVGGRFRPRGQEDVCAFLVSEASWLIYKTVAQELAETSDAAYEKRHKKFEMFEKRQRLREKEKLKHEHYKLKERIEQLRAMDGTAFMSLPASSFSAPPPEDEQEEEEVDAEASQYAFLNGVVPSAEGERRKREMLNVAIKLEQRYAYLLPPDRVRKGAAQESSTSAMLAKKEAESREDPQSDVDTQPMASTSRQESTIRLRIPSIKSSASSTPALSPAPSKLIAPKTGRAVKQAPSTRTPRSSMFPPVVPLPPTEQQPLASSPFIDIESETPNTDTIYVRHRIPSVPPVTTAEDELEPPIARNGINHAMDVDMEPPIPEIVTIKKPRIRKANSATLAPPPHSKRPPKVHHSDDGESEIEEDELKSEAEEGQIGQGVADDVAIVDDQQSAEQQVSPEMREYSTRLQQSNVAGPSAEDSGPTSGYDRTEGGESVPHVLEAHHAPEVPQTQVVESISIRPYKRARKNGAERTRQMSNSARTPSLPPSAVASISRRGQAFAEYISATGEKARTYSSLMISAIRNKNVKIERRRDRYAFGIERPRFEGEYDFELPEDFLYPVDEEGHSTEYPGNHLDLSVAGAQDSTRTKTDKTTSGVSLDDKAENVINGTDDATHTMETEAGQEESAVKPPDNEVFAEAEHAALAVVETAKPSEIHEEAVPEPEDQTFVKNFLHGGMGLVPYSDDEDEKVS